LINLSNTIFILDGPSDILAIRQKIQKEYNCTPEFRKASCNGKNVSPEGYVNSIIGTLMLALSGPYRHIICILDKEKRKLPFQEMRVKVKEAIVTKLLESNQYHEAELNEKVFVFVPDTMLENWIIADVKGIISKKELIKQNTKQGQYDGKSGSTILKKMMKTNYDKTQHAPLLFKVVNFKRAATNSPSFETFYNDLHRD